MSNEIAKKSAVELDGFESEPGFADGRSGGSGDLGRKLKYTTDFRWVDPNDNEVRIPLIAINVLDRVQKWPGPGEAPVETRTLAPGEDFPDFEKLNSEVPDEWYESFGKLIGPYQGEHVVLFFDPDTMVGYWWPSPITTIGSSICVSELRRQVKLMRKFRGALVYPRVELNHTHMSTRFSPSGRERPYLIIKDWVTFGSNTGTLPAPDPASNVPPSTGPTSATEPTPSSSGAAGDGASTAAPKPASGGTQLKMESVAPVSRAEEMDDEIRF